LISTISRPAADATHASRVALVAEDEWMILLQIAEALQGAGWTVHEADRPESALAVLRAQPEVALLITDIRFGEAMDGWELAAEARRINPAIAVIYASANEKRAESMVSGSIFLGKPCLMDQLIAHAEELAGR
jgi:CheY-like chemotaxis protein